MKGPRVGQRSLSMCALATDDKSLCDVRYVYDGWWQDRPESFLPRGGGAYCEPPFRRLSQKQKAPVATWSLLGNLPSLD